MFSIAPVITKKGHKLLTRASGGEKITFTRFQLGNGFLPAGTSMEDVTALNHAVLTNVAITKTVRDAKGYVQFMGKFDSRTDLSADFRWSELGLFCKGADNVEVLFAYGQNDQYAELIRGGAGDAWTEETFACLLAISEDIEIHVSVLSESSKASLEDFTDHVNDKSAHSVTLLQAGAAAASHTHNVSDFISGVLPISKGGTGVSTMAELEELLGHKIVFGYFIGDDSTRMDITLGFQPLRVYLIAWVGYANRIQYHYVQHTTGGTEHMEMESPYLFMFAPGQNITAEGETSWVTEDADTLFAHGYGGAAVTSTGFAVGNRRYIYPSAEGYPNGMSSIQAINRGGDCYVFAAVKGS